MPVSYFKIILLTCLMLHVLNTNWIPIIKYFIYGLERSFWCVHGCKEAGHVLVHKQEIVEYGGLMVVMSQQFIFGEGVYFIL